METILNALHGMLPVFHVIMFVGIICKAALMLGFRNFDLPYLVGSYFRFYGVMDKQNATNQWRKKYIFINNLLNYYAYFCAVLCIISLLVFGDIY